MQTLIESFFECLHNNKYILYNEISLQNELGLFLRNQGYTVRFERNISHYTQGKKPTTNFVKKEIDIVFFKGDEKSSQEKYAIELKFPRNGQYPEQMYNFIKDIKFMEEVKSLGEFNDTFVLTIVDDKNFYNQTKNSNSNDGNNIYKYFRGNPAQIPNGKIEKPTGKIKTDITLNNTYEIVWNKIKYTGIIEGKDTPMYYLLKIK